MSPLPGFFTSPPPSVGVEIASDRVTAVSLVRQGDSWGVGAHGSERLPPGVVTPALNAVNIHDPRAVAAALRAAFDKLGARARRIALVIPDTAAKVSLLRFEKVPSQNDLDQLIRWQMRKAAPFKPEEAQLSWAPAAALPGGGREYLVTLARRDIVESYMRVCADAGAEAGVVDLASLNLVNAAIASVADASGDWLVVHVAPDYATLAIVRNKDLIFFRTRPSTGSGRPEALEGGQLEGEADLADVVHQTKMYYEDRLEGARFARVVLSGAAARGADGGERLRRSLEERLGVKVAPVDALAPAAGVVLRERVA
ncbi:MAG TPA: pilus assembly protein PilM [Vicinamibacterales bacterium]|nr:pilus assembly protein PilM [Vicinamibacterales bacterium]